MNTLHEEYLEAMRYFTQSENCGFYCPDDIDGFTEEQLVKLYNAVLAHQNLEGDPDDELYNYAD